MDRDIRYQGPEGDPSFISKSLRALSGCGEEREELYLILTFLQNVISLFHSSNSSPTSKGGRGYC